jgi:hypothetical protein
MGREFVRGIIGISNLKISQHNREGPDPEILLLFRIDFYGQFILKSRFAHLFISQLNLLEISSLF